MHSETTSQTLAEKIAAAIADDIVAGRYAPGERLVEARLVEAFAVSHGPVRDALRVLHANGLVQCHAYRGAEVTTLSVREVQEIYQVRAALVGLRARWLAEDADRGDVVERAEAAVAELAAIAQNEDDEAGYVRIALSLNRMLTENLSNRWLRSMLQALTLQTSRYTRLALATPERRRESARLWATLLEAIKAGSGSEAEQIASAISLATRDAAIRHLQEREDGSASTRPVLPKVRSRSIPKVTGIQ